MLTAGLLAYPFSGCLPISSDGYRDMTVALQCQESDTACGDTGLTATEIAPDLHRVPY